MLGRVELPTPVSRLDVDLGEIPTDWSIDKSGPSGQTHTPETWTQFFALIYVTPDRVPSGIVLVLCPACAVSGRMKRCRHTLLHQLTTLCSDCDTAAPGIEGPNRQKSSCPAMKISRLFELYGISLCHRWEIVYLHRRVVRCTGEGAGCTVHHIARLRRRARPRQMKFWSVSRPSLSYQGPICASCKDV
jgi:hypothetical protein